MDRVMNHAEAVRTQAAERYLLGEMTPADREAYEEHFFSCVECAAEVQAGAAFIDNARQALATGEPQAASTRPEVSTRAWWNWILRPAFALPAMALLLVVAIYQTTYVIPHMKAELSEAARPQTLPSLSLLSADSRGGETPQITIPASKPLGLFVDIPPGQAVAGYDCEVEDETGKAVFSVGVSLEEARQTVLVMIPVHKLSSGKYVLVVRGSDTSQATTKIEIARYPFMVNVSH